MAPVADRIGMCGPNAYINKTNDNGLYGYVGNRAKKER